MASDRPKTPPAQGIETPHLQSPLTPEQSRRIETNRLKAKALYEQNLSRIANSRAEGALPATTPNGFIVSKNSPTRYAPLSSKAVPKSIRDASNGSPSSQPSLKRPLDASGIQPAQKFAKYVEYDFSKMTDTKGGFLAAEDDPHNKALHASGPGGDQRPAHMSLKEWERLQLLRSLRDRKAGPFEPSINMLNADSPAAAVCRECSSMEIDWKWAEVFSCQVCNSCKDKMPDKYSLLTKTEAREDYLLTDPELRDPEILPHLDKPNPHKSTWNTMMLYLRYQVEEYAFSPAKWGSAVALDEEFARREAEKKRRKEKKFKEKLNDLKRKTRVEAHRRNRGGGKGGGEEAGFGDDLGDGKKHVHRWGRVVFDAEGEEGVGEEVGIKTCVDCGMEVEELEF
ncbi:MAG: hypothetical protein M1829_001210 [Trizodia sp. TS-e1964]|nr:MAG: hypothetical protein M1829_001210 [Trizodia sp. TS-e1964]